METYVTLLSGSSAEYCEKRSRFIAVASPCDSEAAATALLSDLKSKYWDARHNCYAYVLKDGTARFSDDGEPHGTAGKPILDVIKGSGVTDVIITVTRYFGGVLLGTGGLVKAYSTSARDALLSAPKAKMCPSTVLSVECPYSDHGKLMNLLEGCDISLEDTVFTDKVTVVFSIKQEHIEEFEKKLCESFSARLTAKRLQEKYSAFKI